MKLEFESSDEIDFSYMKNDVILQAFIDTGRLCLCIPNAYNEDIIDYVTVRPESIITKIKNVDFDNMTIEIDDNIQLPKYQTILPKMILTKSTDSDDNNTYICKRIICFNIK